MRETDLLRSSIFLILFFQSEKRGLLQAKQTVSDRSVGLLGFYKKMALMAMGLRPRLRTYREKWQSDPLRVAIYQKIFERGKLILPQIEPELLCGSAGSVIFPALHPLYAGEDTPLTDLLFLLNFAKAKRAKRILEVGTYRARTTLAFHLNCPDALVVSYDIAIRPSLCREMAQNVPSIQFRLKSFAEASADLLQEPKYDLIFIDGSHKKEDVLQDSRLAIQIVAEDGAIIWHDYRIRDYRTDTLEVPEALRELSPGRPLFWVRGTTCAILADSRAGRPGNVGGN